MRIHPQIGKTLLTILIDSGSTYNFLHLKIAKVVGLKLESGCLFSVLVANGERLLSLGCCNGVQLMLQGTPIEVDFFLLLLEGCNAILGVQWLGTLDPIL